LTLLLLACAGCGTPRYDVEYDYDTRADFDGLKRYAWLKGQGSETGSSRVDSILRAALDRNLGRMGMERVDADPDFYVACTLETRREVGARGIDTRTMLDQRYGYDTYAFDGDVREPVQVVDYVEGTLFIDVVGRDGKRPIWRGWARGAIPESGSDAKIRAEATEVMRRILEKFPPPATRRTR